MYEVSLLHKRKPLHIFLVTQRAQGVADRALKFIVSKRDSGRSADQRELALSRAVRHETVARTPRARAAEGGRKKRRQGISISRGSLFLSISLSLPPSLRGTHRTRRDNIARQSRAQRGAVRPCLTRTTMGPQSYDNNDQLSICHSSDLEGGPSRNARRIAAPLPSSSSLGSRTPHSILLLVSFARARALCIACARSCGL